MFASRGVEFEFALLAPGFRSGRGRAVGGLPIKKTAVYNYMGNVVYNWGDEDSVLRPFVFGGLGATHYAFGDFRCPSRCVPPGFRSTIRDPLRVSVQRR